MVAPAANDVAKTLWQVAPKHHLAGKWIDLLRDGDHTGRYRSRSEAAMALALAMTNAGWTWPDWHREMTDDTNRLAAWALTRPDGTTRTTRDTTRRLESTWTKAQARAADRPAVNTPTDTQHLIGEIRATASTRTWHGPGGRRDRDVLTALLDLATQRGTTTPQTSVRALCEHTAYRSARTISTALRSLTEAGWLTPDRDPRRSSATTYRLALPRGGQGGQNLHMSTSHTPREAPVQELPTHRARSCAQRELRDLGLVLTPTAVEVYAALTDEPVSAREVSRRSGVSRRTVDGWLPRLAKLGLARDPAESGRWVRGDTEPGVVAMERDVVGAELGRAARHMAERVRWREQMAVREAVWLAGREAARLNARKASPCR